MIIKILLYNKINLEADNYAQFEQMYMAEPDIIQLDKWSLEDVKKALDLLQLKQKDILLSVAGGGIKIMYQIMPNWGIRLFYHFCTLLCTARGYKGSD